jgi:hypothetical protein
VLEKKRLRNQGTDAARPEQPGQGGDEMEQENGQIAHRRMAAGRGIVRNLWRNNNSPATGSAYFLLISATTMSLCCLRKSLRSRSNILPRREQDQRNWQSGAGTLRLKRSQARTANRPESSASSVACSCDGPSAFGGVDCARRTKLARDMASRRVYISLRVSQDFLSRINRRTKVARNDGQT